MTWTQTHRRTDALREIEAIAAADPSAALPWREEYADVFGSRDQLVALLRARWQTRLTAQLDPHVTEAVQDQLETAVRRRSVGLLRILDRLDREELASERLSPVDA